MGYVDLDGDGLSNALDLDSDGDGIPDVVEVGGVDANNDGRLDGFTDSDLDGLADSVDGDANNDMIIENLNGPLLKTGTALATGRASAYPFKNADFMGRPNPYDLDSDGDGIADVIEAGFPGSVGITNGQVSGARTNGWATSVQALAALGLRNTDGRGPANYLDIDSDDDGITDNIEAQATNGYILPDDLDTDLDGIADVYDISKTTFGGNGLTPYDHDGDGTPDYRDFDTDNDGALDINEASRLFNITIDNINQADTDGDGLLDEFDVLNITSLTAGNLYRNVTNSNFGTGGNYNGPVPSGSSVKMVGISSGIDRDWRASYILPLTITSFKGAIQTQVAHLTWVVSNGTDVDHYLVQRSSNALVFDDLESLKAINTATQQVYRYPDDLSAYLAGMVYYRIVQVNKNGTVNVSKIIALKKEGAEVSIKVYPNPVSDVLIVEIPSLTKQAATAIIYDATGKELMQKPLLINKGVNQFRFTEVSRLLQGFYTLRIITNTKTYIEKLVKE